MPSFLFLPTTITKFKLLIFYFILFRLPYSQTTPLTHPARPFKDRSSHTLAQNLLITFYVFQQKSHSPDNCPHGSHESPCHQPFSSSSLHSGHICFPFFLEGSKYSSGLHTQCSFCPNTCPHLPHLSIWMASPLCSNLYTNIIFSKRSPMNNICEIIPLQWHHIPLSYVVFPKGVSSTSI